VHTWKLEIEYEGTRYRGWQMQHNAKTVQGELMAASRKLFSNKVDIHGAGRTDAGVHAREQVAHFDTNATRPLRGWLLGLNRELPREIAVVRAARTPARFEPRRCVHSKTYVYRILESRTRDPLVDQFAWRIPYRLNHSVMQAAAASLQGEHDFRAFRGAADAREDTVRHIFRIELTPAVEDSRITELTVTGNKFLYNMLRIIAGTLVDIGRGHLPPDAVSRAFRSGLRKDLGITAPPEGLVLAAIELSDMGQEPWPVG